MLITQIWNPSPQISWKGKKSSQIYVKYTFFKTTDDSCKLTNMNQSGEKASHLVTFHELTVLIICLYSRQTKLLRHYCKMVHMGNCNVVWNYNGAVKPNWLLNHMLSHKQEKTGIFACGQGCHTITHNPRPLKWLCITGIDPCLYLRVTPAAVKNLFTGSLVQPSRMKNSYELCFLLCHFTMSDLKYV